MRLTMTAVAALLIGATAAHAEDPPERRVRTEQSAPRPAPRAQPAPAVQARPAVAAPRPQFTPAPRPQVAPAFIPRQPMAAPAGRPERPAARPFPDRQTQPLQARPERPERMERPERAERPQLTPRPERADRPERAERPQLGERPERVERPQRVERPERAERPERVDRPERTDRQERVERPERAERPERPANDARPPRPDRPDRAPRAERPDRGQPRAPGAPGRDRNGRADLPSRPDRNRAPVARPGRTVRLDPVRSRQIRQQLRDRRAARTNWNYRIGDRRLRVVRANPYRYPSGWRYRVWRRGDRFPAALLLSSYFLNNYYAYDLGPPPSGYAWYRFGPDAVLVNTSDYDIADTRYGVFYEGGSNYGSEYGGGYGDADLPSIDPNLPEGFLTGDLDLQSIGGSCDDFYGNVGLQNAIDEAWRDQDWNGLASLVLEGGCETDLSYYLLGLSAEGLVLPDAAASFYQRALDLSLDRNFQDNCEAWGDEACRDLYIDDEASDGLERIYGGGQDYDRR